MVSPTDRSAADTRIAVPIRSKGVIIRTQRGETRHTHLRLVSQFAMMGHRPPLRCAGSITVSHDHCLPPSLMVILFRLLFMHFAFFFFFLGCDNGNIPEFSWGPGWDVSEKTPQTGTNIIIFAENDDQAVSKTPKWAVIVYASRVRRPSLSWAGKRKEKGRKKEGQRKDKGMKT